SACATCAQIAIASATCIIASLAAVLTLITAIRVLSDDLGRFCAVTLQRSNPRSTCTSGIMVARVADGRTSPRAPPPYRPCSSWHADLLVTQRVPPRAIFLDFHALRREIPRALLRSGRRH